MAGSKSLLWEVQQAVYGVLSGDATLMGMVTDVYDEPDDDADAPYVVVGEGTEVPFDVFGTSGKNSTLTIHVYSEYDGKKELVEIHNRILTLLDHADVALTGFALVHLVFETANTQRDPDGITRQLNATYRVTAQEA